MSNKIASFLLILFCAIILSFSIRGIAGNPTINNINNQSWKENGPFELSPERGRFALLYSMMEYKSFYFSNSIAEFASPDVGIHNGHYVSLFAPLLSFIVVPGYVIGKFFGASQVGSFAIIAIFALLNFILLRLVAIRLGAHSLPATVAALIFLFGTPAFAYAANLYQHHISTFLILLSFYALLKSNKPWSLAVVFFLCATAIPLDYPNLFFMFPLGLFAAGRIFSFKKIRSTLSMKINLLKIMTPLIMVIPILFFFWFNNTSYGNPFQLSGTIQTTKLNDQNLESKVTLESVTDNSENTSKTRSAIGFFKTRNILRGFYIHLVSPDRGIIYYTPVVIFGILGFILALKKNAKMTALLTSVIGVNILLYSMWGDPWGGWAFGSRYLIPSYAILSIFIALLLTYWRKKILLFVVFLPVAMYSIAINTLGAITTSAIPPQVEVLQLEKLSGIIQRYTYQRNWEFLLSGHSKSFVYQTFLKPYLSPLQFYQFLTFSICILVIGILFYYFFITKKEEGNV